MRVAVVGGTGFIGAQLVDRLGRAGHEVSALSRSTGVDLTSGEGLADALNGVDVVVDAINSPTLDADAVGFFESTTRNLLAAAASAGVAHLVLLSIVGIDRVTEVGYYRAKLAQENALAAGPLPYSIVRATQFMEFVTDIMGWTTDGDTVRLPATPLQPVAAADVVEALADVATGSPIGGVLNVAGPDVVPLNELGVRTLAAHPDGRHVVIDESAGLFGQVDDDALTAPPRARLGRISYREFLAAGE